MFSRSQRTAAQRSVIPSSLPYPNRITFYGENVTIKYLVLLKKSDSAVVYEAEINSEESAYRGTKLILKFTQKYCVEAHQLLAGDCRHNALAPILHSVIRLGGEGNWMVIVMEKIENSLGLFEIRALSVSRRSTIVSDIGRAVQRLHDQGIVHGDIRLPNILITSHPLRAHIIDFDYSGKEGTVLYPPTLDFGIFVWVNEADFPNILKAHDIAGIQRFSKDIRA
eukprot:scaffold5365_cov169-Ochromonas_danica.AAC.4